MEDSRFRKTRRMILSRVLLLPFVIVMLVCGTLVYYFARYSRDQVEEDLARIASGHRRFIGQFLAERASDLQLATSLYSIRELRDTGRLVELFRSLQKKNMAFFDLGVFDEDGNHLAYVGPYDLAGKNYAETEWFRAVREKGLYISEVFLGYRNIPHFIIAVRRDEGGRAWYLRATIDTLSFNELVESIRIGKTGEAYLVNRNGVFQTRRRSGGSLMEHDPDYKYYMIDDRDIKSFSVGEYFDQRHLYAAGPLLNTNWVFVVRQEIGDAYGPLAKAALVAVSMIIGGGGVVVLMAYILASSLANQLSLAEVEKKQMRTQLIIAGKLAEVGEMSAGLAHEINNPLQVMKSEYTLIQDVIGDLERNNECTNRQNLDMIKDSVNQIGLQIDRCKQITQGLLKFARKPDSSMQVVKIQNFLPEVVNMIERRAQIENISIIQEFDPDIPPIIGDANQLQQVFLNLINNAVYALRDKKEGEVRIRAGMDGSNISVEVADNGCGIPPENMEKIFLPFFTTKPVGQGTGLGLSTAYGIIKGMGGDMTVTSEVDAGTVFTVLLPMALSESENKGE